MKLGFLFFGDNPDEKWELCKQMGVQCAIAKLAPELTGRQEPWRYDAMYTAYSNFEDNGLKLIGLEGDQFDMNRIKFGLPGREVDVMHYCEMLENMGRLGVKLLCYNFMAGIGWYRTHTALKERGGALVSGFDYAYSSLQPLTSYGGLEEERLWDNYAWFLEQVLPVAEKAGVKMALHPDDPPVSPLRGIARIFTSADAIRRALALSENSSHGLTFCQGTYVTMGEDVVALIEEFRKRIFFVHVRDVIGNNVNFRETFHDNGPTDMVATFKAYKQFCPDIPLRSDHVPTMAGEDNENHGYAMKGNLFGIGYMKGLMEALEISVE
ncbi:mannonate dehydratase [Pedobacter sp.]